MSIVPSQQMENCIGCKLCVLACSLTGRQTLSVQGSSLRIREKNGNFAAEVDLGTCLACEECAKICPRNCLKTTVGNEP